MFCVPNFTKEHFASNTGNVSDYKTTFFPQDGVRPGLANDWLTQKKSGRGSLEEDSSHNSITNLWQQLQYPHKPSYKKESLGKSWGEHQPRQERSRGAVLCRILWTLMRLEPGGGTR